MSSCVRELLMSLGGGPQVWLESEDLDRYVAVLQPLAEVAVVAGDSGMLASLLMLAGELDLVRDVAWPAPEDRPRLSRSLPVKEVVAALLAAGRTRDAAAVVDLDLQPEDADRLGEASHHLAGVALALGNLRGCRMFVMAARVVDRALALV